MSHPASVSLADLYYDPLYLSHDSQLAYMMSFEDCAMCEKSIHFSPKDIYESPLDSYSFVDFTKEAFERLYQQSQEELKQRGHEVTKAVRSSFKEYFLRAASKTLGACLMHVNSDFAGQYGTLMCYSDYMFNKTAIAEQVRSDFRLEALRGNVPNKWPDSVQEFNNDLSELPITAFASEAEQIVQQFLTRVQNTITSSIKSNQSSFGELGEMCKAFIGVAIRSANFSVVLSALSFLSDLGKSLNSEQNRVLACTLWSELERLLKLINEIPQKPQLQYLRSLGDMGGFGIMRKLHFQKQNYYYNSMTTDGQYLYLYVSAAYGGMFKIGTGENSEAGRVYLFHPVNKVEEVSWVYVRGKLYLRSSSKEAKNLDIIDPETFKTEGSIQLHCPSLFGHQIVQNINKNNPLLTDGQYLYIVGKRLTTEKLPDPPKAQPEESKDSSKDSKDKEAKEPPKEPLPAVPKDNPPSPSPAQTVSSEETEKEKRKKEKLIKKKERRKGQEENVLKLLEFVLFEFDVTSSNGAEAQEYQNDSELVRELCDSFSGYFTINECRKALNINKDDLAGAAQWLVDEGEKERTKRTHTFTRSVVLAQAEVTNEAHQKPLKSANEIQLKEDSIMFPHHVSEFIWTCSRDQVTCYSDSGIKVFSKNEKHYKPIHKEDITSEDRKYRLQGTYLGSAEGQRTHDRSRRFGKTPEYLIVYDNFAKKYYTFNWVNNEHVFPALVTVSRDYVHYQEQIARSHQPVSFERPPETLLEVAAHTLNTLTKLEERRLEMQTRPSSWLYTYYCLLSQINQKIRNVKPEEAELKKKLINKRNKTVSKMNKILELSRAYVREKQQLKDWGKAVRQVKLESLFCLNGRIQTLELLEKLLDGVPDQQRLYFQLLDIWVLQADQIILDYAQYLGGVGQRLFERLKSLREGEAHDQLLVVLLRGFYLFFPKQEQQYAFLLGLLKIEFVDLVDFHFRPFSNRHSLFQSFIEELRVDQVVERYENGSDFEKFFGSSYFNTYQAKQVNDLGNLLLDGMEHPKNYQPQHLVDVSYIKSMVPGNRLLKEQLLERVTRGLQEESEEVAIFYRTLVVRAIRYIKEFHNQKFESVHLSALLIDTLKVVEQALAKLPYKSHGAPLRIGSLVVQAYIASPVSLTPSREVVVAINGLLQSMLRPDLLPLLNSAHLYNLEGVSQTLQKIMETNHPYDRDRKLFFEPQNHPQSLFMVADFDKRCQSDANNDFLQIISWTHGQAVSNVNANCNPFNMQVKMSGKINSKKPYMMLGSQLTMEFHSSGNTRNEHSLNRYGFRVGVRPAYSGRLELEKSDIADIINRFGSQEQFEEYVGLLKLLTVTASTSAENLLMESRVANEDTLSSYLEGKIFTQGLEEENLQKLAGNTIEERNNLLTSFLKNEHHRDRWNFIARQLFECNKIRVGEEAEAVIAPADTELWNLSGIPAHIKPYIEEIKNYRGNFINLFLEARSHVKDLRVYTVEATRPTFTGEYKKLWMMGEALLFLTVLKHSGLLQLSLEFSIEYIKENLQAFEEARNGIISFFINRMQIARVWQELVETYHKKEEVEEQKPKQQAPEVKKNNVTIKKTGKKITVKLDKTKKEEQPIVLVKQASKKVKFNPEVTIREELTNPTKIKNLCNFKRLPYLEEDMYSNVTEIITKLQQEKPSNESVYQGPAMHLIRSCLFLLRLKSNNNREEPLANIKPPGVYRSISDGAADESKIDKNKVVVFREWLENWKKWKGFRKEQRVELKFPVKEIVDFINGWVDEKEITEVMYHRHKRLQKRLEMVGQLTSLTKVVQGTLLEKYVLGTLTANLPQGLMSKIEATSETLRNQLAAYNNELQVLLRVINEQRQKRFPVTLASFQAEAQKQQLMPRLKAQALSNLLLFSDMELPPLDTALYYLSFRQMSNTSDEMIQLANRIVYKAMQTDYSIEELVRTIRRELGCDTLSMRRWKDVIFIERILFLLLKTEAKVRLSDLEIDQKQLLATGLFYLVYHIEAPLVSKLAIRLINRLELRKVGSLSTPFDVEYLNISVRPAENPVKKGPRSLQVQPYQHATATPMDNWEILHQRCGENFFCVREPIKAALLPKTDSDKKVHILLHLTSEEDLCWIINVLYYIEELTPTLKPIGSWEEYLAEKAKKEQNKDKKELPQSTSQAQQQQSNKEQRTEEKILVNLPENITLQRELEDKLPIGWFLSYNNSFHQFRSNKLENYRRASGLKPPQQPQPNRKGTPNQRRNWQSPNLLKLYKKYEQLHNKPLEEPKEADPADEKEQFVKARNFIARMRKHTQEALALMTQLMNHGYAFFAESEDPERTEMFCQLVEFGKQNRLIPIPCQFTKKDYKAKLAPGDILVAENQSGSATSELKIEFVRSSFYPTLQYMLEMAETTAKEGNYTETNRSEMVFRDNQQMSWEEISTKLQTSQEEGYGFLGKELVESRWFRQKRKHHQVVIRDFEQQEYSVVQGGVDSGIKKCTIVSNSDVNTTSQSIDYDSLLPKPREKNVLDRDEIVEELKRVLYKPLPKIDSIQACQTHIEIKCVLAKAALVDWQFYEDKDQIKELAGKLTELSRRTTPKKTVKQYEEELQRLLGRLRETSVDALEVVSFYDRVAQVHPRLERLLVAPVEKKETNTLEQKIETIGTHFLPTSNYLSMIDTLPQQIEENKLLKYWEKYILPRIEEFVKSSFKPLEIQEYFEQMRIPLRKHDQFEAIKVAYVLCENKLPPGATLLDANHDWDSLTIEEATVGRFALLKLPKSASESSTPILRSRGAEELSLVQIVFVDVRTNNLLVRRRLETHSIIHYFWVALSSVVPVQTPIPKMTLQEVYRTTEDCLNGVVCCYSKQLLSRLSDIVEVDRLGLLRQNIRDRFVRDPITGWLHDSKEWPLQPLLEKMLKENNHSALEMLESEFKEFKAYDTDLFTNELKRLNLFPNATALVVSFKRTSKLSMCSGLRFYNDQLALNEVAHVYTGKSERSNFEPVILSEPNIYSRYYSNMDNLPQFEQISSISKLEVTIYGVEPIWTTACFLAEKIGQLAHQNCDFLEQLSRLNRLFVNWIILPGCYVLRAHAATAVIRLTNRIVYVARKKNIPVTMELLGVSKEKLDRIGSIVKEIDEEESKDLIILYSSFLQKISEMLANLIAPLVPELTVQAPPFVKEMVDVGNICRYILRDSGKWPDSNAYPIAITKEPNPQWERFMLVEGLPLALPASEVRNKVISIIGENKGRILAPALDVYYEEGKVMVLVDGWDVLELVEEDVIEKMVEEEQKEPEEDEEQMLSWNCGFCTFENQPGAEACEMCGAAAPVNKPKEAVFQKVQTADLAAADRKLREKEAKRFEAVKEKIREYVGAYWKVQQDKVTVENNAITEKIKQRAEEAKRREERDQKKKRKKATKQEPKEEQLKLLPVPEAQPCTITTGSQVLNNPLIENFLQKRLEPTPDINNLMELLKKFDSDASFLEKFRFLEKEGYDLWGVHVSHPDATLLPYDLLLLLMRYVQTQICKETSSVLSYNPNAIRLISQCQNMKNSASERPVNFSIQNQGGIQIKYKRLTDCKPYNLRYSWTVIKAFNAHLSQSMPYISLGRCRQAVYNRSRVSKLDIKATLGEEVCAIRDLIMCGIKSELSQKVTQRTAAFRDVVPKIVLERLKIKQGERKQIVSAKQKDEYFLSRAYEQLKLIPPTQLRPFKPKGTESYLAFEVAFKGEYVQGETGPYRQFFTDLSGQLHPSRNMGLLIATPNNSHNEGESRSKYMINPTANNSYQLSLFEFIGLLMGCSIRTGAHLALDLPAMLWKQIVGQDIGNGDFEEIDVKFCEYAKGIIECPNEQTFAEIDALYWVGTLSNGTEVELQAQGKTTQVQYKDRLRFVNKLIELRVKQNAPQVKSLRKGISQMIPEPYLNCLSGEDLEVMVCGRPKVDVELLKKHTKYSGSLNESSQRIVFFWNILREMKEVDRLRFIKFCWGQDRLPVNSEEFERNGIRFMIKPTLNDSGPADKMLPRADTCFFNIELPDYSTEAIMREKIMLAINTDSDSMNAQEVQQEHAMMGVESSFDEGDYEEGGDGGGGGMEEE